MRALLGSASCFCEEVVFQDDCHVNFHEKENTSKTLNEHAAAQALQSAAKLRFSQDCLVFFCGTLVRRTSPVRGFVALVRGSHEQDKTGNVAVILVRAYLQRVFIKSFFRSKFPRKFMKLSLSSTCMKNKLTDSCGN